MNMIRVGGTMTYETDAFHDLCDELGILVWQDFMFANMDYPWEDEAFVRVVALEATQTLERLQSRPSLAVVCGSSEVALQAAMLGLKARQPNRLFDEYLPDLVHAIAPGAVWLPATPTGGTFPFQVDSGVSHYYGGRGIRILFVFSRGDDSLKYFQLHAQPALRRASVRNCIQHVVVEGAGHTFRPRAAQQTLRELLTDFVASQTCGSGYRWESRLQI
jgi:hypothetical protein